MPRLFHLEPARSISRPPRTPISEYSDPRMLQHTIEHPASCTYIWNWRAVSLGCVADSVEEGKPVEVSNAPHLLPPLTLKELPDGPERQLGLGSLSGAPPVQLSYVKCQRLPKEHQAVPSVASIPAALAADSSRKLSFLWPYKVHRAENG